MKIGIMQPYFFPYVGYFQLMAHVDKWVLFDDIQFVNKGWVNRNRILHPDPIKEWQYITLPLEKRGRLDKINGISINTSKRWKSEILGKLTSYKKKAPYYRQTFQFVESCLEIDEENLSKFLTHSIKKTADYLSIDADICVQSEMNLDLGAIEHPGQWALRISEKLKAAEYINPITGCDLFRPEEFDGAGIRLSFITSKLSPYVQRREGFVPGLSIIDIMMWNDVENIKAMLNENYEIMTIGCTENE